MYEAYHHQQVHYHLVQILPNISCHKFTPNRTPVLTQQLTADDTLNQNAWDEIMTKLNEMAEENRLIKQAVHKTYNTAAGMLGKAKSKTLVTNSDDKIHIKKKMNPASKGVRFKDAYDHSSDQATNSDFLFQNLNSESGSDEEDNLFSTE